MAPASAIATDLQDPQEVARVAHLIGCDAQDIASRTYGRGRFTYNRRDTINFFGTQIRLRYREPKIRRVSPRALQIAPYHRAAWELRPFSFDPETKELLMDTCPACNQHLSWARALGPTVCDRCAVDGLPAIDLRDFPQPRAEVADEEALDFVTALVLPGSERLESARNMLPPDLREYPNAVLFEAIVELAYGLAGHRPDGPHRVDVQHLMQLTPELLTMAARVFLDGQAAFDALCERYRAKNGKQPGRFGRRKELGALVRWSKSGSGIHPGLQRHFQAMIDSNMKSQVKAELGVDDGAGDVALPLIRMAAECNVRPEILRRLSRSGAIPVVRASEGKLPVQMALGDVGPLIRQFKDALRPSQAARIVGAPAYVLKELANERLIDRMEEPVPQMLQERLAYSRSSVENLMERIKAAASTRAPGEKVAMACSRIRTGTTPWAAIVSAIIQGDARAALDPRAETLKLIQLVAPDPATFVAGVRKHLKIQEAPTDTEWVGAASAGDILKISYAAFWRLVRARPDLIKQLRKGSAPYAIADVRALSAKYIFVGEIALRRQLHPRLAVAWLKSIGTSPAFSVRKKQDLVYLREEVEPSLRD
jgi:hypothetical protein